MLNNDSLYPLEASPSLTIKLIIAISGVSPQKSIALIKEPANEPYLLIISAMSLLAKSPESGFWYIEIKSSAILHKPLEDLRGSIFGCLFKKSTASLNASTPSYVWIPALLSGRQSNLPLK